MSNILNIVNNNIEIIIIDDGSKIKQINFVPATFFQQKNFKIIEQENLGLSIARNIGIINAKGKYLIFVDGDDFIMEDEFILFYNEIASINYSPELIRVGYYRKRTAHRTKKYATNKSVYFGNLSDYVLKIFIFNKLIAFSGWSHIYKKDFLLKNELLFKEKIKAEDLLHLLQSYPKLSTVYVSKYCYYFYDNTNSFSITNSQKNVMGRDIKNFLNPKEIQNNQLKVFFTIWYYLSFKKMYKMKIKGFLFILLCAPFIIFKKNRVD